MTVSLYHDTSGAAAGETRDLVTEQTLPKMENPSVGNAAREEQGKGVWEQTGAIAGGADAMNAKPDIYGLDDVVNDSRNTHAAHQAKPLSGGESPNSALTTCRDGGGSDAAPTRSASRDVENTVGTDANDVKTDATVLDQAAAAMRPPQTVVGVDTVATGSTPTGATADDDANEDARARAACAACFTSADDEGRMTELRGMGQKELQETFRVAFARTTTSNNNQWLRRRIAGALGLEAAPVLSRGVGSGGGAGFLNSASPAGKSTGLNTTPGSTGGTTTEDGVRKSNRAARPKILDFLPSAVCAQVANELPGESAVDRRVRVFWPAEGAFFSGTVIGFNSKNGKHKVRYDDGDAEEVLLAAERIEWVYPGEDATVPRAPATAAGGGALSAKAKAVVVVAKKINYSVPLPGKPAEVLAELGAHWPSPGQHVWGRVKGHGWWPGVVIKAAAAEALGVVTPAAHKDDAAMRAVKFFDNTAASVHKHDLVPFRDYEQTLGKAKKNVSFVAALKLAKSSFDKAAKKGLEVISPTNPTKKEQAAAAKAAMGIVEGATGAHQHSDHKRKSMDVNASAKMLFDPAGVPINVKAEKLASSKVKSPFGKKKARFNDAHLVQQNNAAHLHDLERRVGFTRDMDDFEGDFVRQGEAKIAAQAMMAHGPMLKSNSFRKPQAPKRSHKKGQGLKARAAAEAAGLPWPPPRPPGVGRGRGRAAGGSNSAATSGGSGSGGKHRVPIDLHQRSLGRGSGNVSGGYQHNFGNNQGQGDQLGLLGRKLDALQTRVVPLAIAASQHLRKQLQISQLRGGQGSQTHPSASVMTENERAILLEEMDSLQQLLHWNDGSHGGQGYDPRGRDVSQTSDVHFQQQYHGSGGHYADRAAGMAAERNGSDSDLARLDSNWDRNGLDPIEIAMLQNGNEQDELGNEQNGMATDYLFGNSMARDDGGDEDDALEAADFLRSAGPSIEVDTIMADVHAQRKAHAQQQGQNLYMTKHQNQPTARMGSPALASRECTASPAPSDTTQ